MGLFSSGKSCPICGGETPRLFPTKVQGLPLCKECAGKISMESSMLKSLTIDGLWDHMDYRTANAETFASFMDTEVYGMGGDKLHIDGEKGLFYIAAGNAVNPPIFKCSELKSFNLIEDGRTIAQGNALGFNATDSSIYTYRSPPRKYKDVTVTKPAASAPVQAPKDNMLSHGVNGMANRPSAGHMSPAAANGGRPGSQTVTTIEREEETPSRPIGSLRFTITLENPYWKNKEYQISLPYLNSYNAIPDWINDYKVLVAAAMDTCMALSRMMGFVSPEEKARAAKEKADAIAAIHNAETAAKEAEAAAKEAKATDMAAAVEMIKKWKELLDMGAITQEEFDKKKAEILG